MSNNPNCCRLRFIKTPLLYFISQQFSIAAIQTVLLLAFFISSCFTASAQPVNNHKYNVLFIGNSYTYVNNLPLITANVAASACDTLVYDANAIGGYTLEMHIQNSTTLSKIATGTWDYVVLQEQSQLPSFSFAEVDTEVFPYARYLDSLIHAENSCGKTMFYMTWGRKNGDTMNCPTWPPVCTYTGMDSLLYLRYMMMADSNNSVVSPVGAVRRYIRDHYPAIELYQADESHPTEAGTYAAACCFYTAIFKKDPMLISYDFTLPSADAANIRTAVRHVVYDSMAKWHIGKYDPAALFTSSAGTGNNVTFTNSSVNAASYFWSFGDGQYSVVNSPAHHYSSAGTYDVFLAAINCGKSDTLHSVVTIYPTGIIHQQPASDEFTIAPNPSHGALSISSPSFLSHSYDLVIYNSIGRVVYHSTTCHQQKQETDLSELPNGVFFISLAENGQVVFRDKFFKW